MLALGQIRCRCAMPCRVLASGLLRGHGIATLGSMDALQNFTGVKETLRGSRSLALPTYMVWGADTDVGKTLVSAALAAAAARAQASLLYLKPVQTGYPTHSDTALVEAVHRASEARHTDFSGATTHSRFQTLHAWREAVSPHLAVEREGNPVDDAVVVDGVLQALANFRAVDAESAGEQRASGPCLALVETAGGPASPGPSGTLQCHLYRPLRLPGVLVGSGQLGGISTTICAYETLRLQGLDTAALILLEDGSYGNGAALRRSLPRDLNIYSLPPCPPPSEGGEGMGVPGVDDALARWLEDTAEELDKVLLHLQVTHRKRVARLTALAGECEGSLWWPFTQHAGLDSGSVGVVDARAGEAYDMLLPNEAGGPALAPHYDACASWWTQGVSAELRPRLTGALAYGAARYGHVLHPEIAHRPAADAARLLLDGPGAGWASRVFFSDDGSTAVEVALKMAFRTFLADVPSEATPPTLHVLGLSGAYHGDTLGAMDAVEPSVFNSRQFPWYKGRGLFLDPPTAGLVRGSWQVRLPGTWQEAAQQLPHGALQFESLDALLDPSREGSPLAKQYLMRIEEAIARHEASTGAVVGACLMEPLLLGAGGMMLADPLYQRLLAGAARRRGIPVICDEVFTGLWRLGRVSAASALGILPDIACYAKLLTGGTIPLSATLASTKVFDAFLGPGKVDALLHGHSYSAHPIGCSVAVEALRIFSDPAANPMLCSPEVEGRCPRQPQCSQPCGQLLPQWDPALVDALSHHPRVERVVTMGTVLAAELAARDGGGGYASGEARGVTQALRGAGVYARPLGNVVYLMVTPTTSRATATPLLNTLLQVLDTAGGNGER